MERNMEKEIYLQRKMINLVMMANGQMINMKDMDH